MIYWPEKMRWWSKEETGSRTHTHRKWCPHLQRCSRLWRSDMWNLSSFFQAAQIFLCFHPSERDCRTGSSWRSLSGIGSTIRCRRTGCSRSSKSRKPRTWAGDEEVHVYIRLGGHILEVDGSIVLVLRFGQVECELVVDGQVVETTGGGGAVRRVIMAMIICPI